MTTAEVAERTGVPERVLHYWASIELVKVEGGGRSGWARRWTEANVEQVRALARRAAACPYHHGAWVRGIE